MVNVPEISQAARENHTNYMNKEILQNIDSVVESISDEDVNNLAELYHMTKDDNEDEVIVNFNESEEVMDIKVEDLQDSEFSEYIPGSSDLIEIVKHEINVDDQDNTSHHNEDIDTKHDDEYGCGTPTGNYICIIIYNMIYIFGPQEIILSVKFVTVLILCLF